MQLLEHQLKTNQPNKQTSERESKLEKALIQQYLRKDCLELTGIPVPPCDRSKQLVMELCPLTGVNISEYNISKAHRLPERLPETRKVEWRSL